MNKKIRYSGVLLHPTSLPSKHGIGDFGDAARNFIDLLASASVGLWQILPLGPVGYGNSPYASRSAFAGNELLISLELLADQGYLDLDEIIDHPQFPENRVDFESVESFKRPLLVQAAHTFLAQASTQDAQSYTEFCKTQKDWLDDYALYSALADHYNDSRWYSAWDVELTRRTPKALAYWTEKKQEEIAIWKVLQFFFYQQWKDVKNYANENGVAIVGDLPIFVASDSVDAWSHREFIKMDKDGSISALSGVPPDAFSSTGQLWGNPVYDWEALEADDFSWWIRRMEHQFDLFDMVRLDHFRGFQAYWEVPSGQLTAENGEWITAPGRALFTTMRQHFGKLPVIAEDLGVITPAVEALRDSNNFPGMKILQFAFNLEEPGRLDPENPYLPHNYDESCVAYTGTHDNDTTKGWFEKLHAEEKDIIRRYLSCNDEGVPWHMVRAVMVSCARYAIVPMQDILGLGSEGRMNTPGTVGELNWTWRVTPQQISKEVSARLVSIVQPFKRDATYQELSLVIS
ncbi:MAG: 4-alpha-glucanotransferase [Sphaerochaetaceae bacterium]|jgi:4-alpha-glucanotransferase|nr:4-alpha-glucanotransferase [Sphaerochaetaceae bacterium]MDD4218855.1 4-alpha-glucanotransferase [Sphaerochaetaceae bacterium]MDY0371299.1 4-alpha-glucanotransferase [Sphaerochaetaceae bacterium]